MVKKNAIFLANVRDERPPLASGVPPAREADKQESCQKSRRDGGSLDRLVSIIFFHFPRSQSNGHCHGAISLEMFFERPSTRPKYTTH